MRLNRRNPRGAASVEAAISMIVIIPAFMYALFMDDLLRYTGDLQEAVVSTPWDFTGQNFMQGKSRGLKDSSKTASDESDGAGGKTAVQHQARLMFCDHESSGDSYERNQDCGEDDAHNHHGKRAFVGHVCWLNPKYGEQITCDAVQSDVGVVSGGPEFSSYSGQYAQAGGLYSCHGKEVVENYLLPKTFLAKFSGEDKYAKGLSKEKHVGKGMKDIHDNAKGGTMDTAYPLAEQRFAVLMDPWALNESAASGGEDDESEVKLETEPNQSNGAMYDRVDHMFKRNVAYGPFVASATAFTARAIQQQLIGFVRDNPATPRLSFPKKASGVAPQQDVDQVGGKTKYYSSAWKDWSKNPTEATANARGNYYMGCKSAQKDDCL